MNYMIREYGGISWILLGLPPAPHLPFFFSLFGSRERDEGNLLITSETGKDNIN